MNAMSPFASFATIESASASAAAMSIRPDGFPTEIHESLRSVAGVISANRRVIQNMREMLPRVAFASASTAALEDFIVDLEAREAAAKQDRRNAAVRINAISRGLPKARRYLRPSVERIGYVIDLAAVEKLVLLRDVRLEAIYELASRPHEHDGPIMSNSDDVKKYFGQLIAA